MIIHTIALTFCLCLSIYYGLRLVADYLCYKRMKFGVAQICAILWSATIIGFSLIQYADADKLIFEICVVAIVSAMVCRSVLHINKEW